MITRYAYILLFVFGCLNQKDNFIESLATKYRDRYISTVIYANKNRKKVRIIVENTDLYNNVFLEKYTKNYVNFHIFLKDLIIGKLTLKEEDLDLIVFETVRNKTPFLKADTFVSIDSILVLKDNSKRSKDDNIEIVCLMFDKGYYPLFDDYSGTWKFYKKLGK